MKLSLAKSVIFVASCAFAAAAGAQAYKWIDKDGRTRYGDTPPTGVKATPLQGVPAAPVTAPAAPKDAKSGKPPLSPEAAFRKREQEREEADQKAAKERAEADTRRVNCERAQAGLRMLESGQRVATTNQAGERVFLDDAQRAKEAERAQQAVKDWCQ